MHTSTFFWHDYETFGVNPRWDRPCQFAGLRTDDSLNVIGDPVNILCQPPEDYLPEPEACLITGITPQSANNDGIPEPEFARAVHSELAAAGTCGVGYNSIRFDDEVSRHLFYRNFYDPYGREWQNGCSRWDIIDLIRACYALRPEGINWPTRDDGPPSFKLEHLSQANNLDHANAHDALSDVNATLGMARLVKATQPKLWEFALQLRDKHFVRSQVDYVRMQPFVHVSGMFPASRGHLALVVPIAVHPERSNEFIVYDLSTDPSALLSLDADAIADHLYTPTADLPDDAQRVPLKTIHINRAPMISPLAALKDVDFSRINLDYESCREHLTRIQMAEGLAEKVRKVFAQPREYADSDPESALYDGFIPKSDQKLFPSIRASDPAGLGDFASQLTDPRLQTLLFRYRARHHYDQLNQDEKYAWDTWRKQQLCDPDSGEGIRSDYLQRLAAVREGASVQEKNLLDNLEQYARELVAGL